MKKLLTAALVLSLAGAATAADEKAAALAPAAAAEPSAKPARDAKAPARKGAAKKKAAKAKEGTPVPAPVVETGPQKPAEKPCEPVKPCPID